MKFKDTRCLYIIQIGRYWDKVTYFFQANQEIKLQITGTVFVASDSDNLLLPALPWFLDFNRKTIKGKKGTDNNFEISISLTHYFAGENCSLQRQRCYR